jgi:hypothetical protein
MARKICRARRFLFASAREYTIRRAWKARANLRMMPLPLSMAVAATKNAASAVVPG